MAMHPIVQLCMAIDEHVEAQDPNQENSCRLLPRCYQGSAQTASDALRAHVGELKACRPSQSSKRCRLRADAAWPRADIESKTARSLRYTCRRREENIIGIPGPPGSVRTPSPLW